MRQAFLGTFEQSKTKETLENLVNLKCLFFRTDRTIKNNLHLIEFALVILIKLAAHHSIVMIKLSGANNALRPKQRPKL